MLKLVALVLILTGLALADFCPAQPITSDTLGGNLPNGVANLTDVPQGTNCTFNFNIPNNYALKLTFNAQAGSTADQITIYDNNGDSLYTVSITTTPIYNIPLWLPARAASVRVEAVSGNMRFMLGYMYQSLANYQQVTKRTGEYFPLSSIAANTYMTITTSTANEKVVVTPGYRTGKVDVSTEGYYVFDGDNINTANVMGRLYDFSDIQKSSGQSVSIVNFGNAASNSYALGNDASTLDGFSKYLVYVTSKGSSIGGNMTDLSDTKNGAAYTWICTDCSTFYWTDFGFNSLATISNKGFATFQGQTPTHKRDKLIRYDPMTVTDSYFPQIIPNNVLTINLYLSSVAYQVNTINDDTAWRKPYIGRKGYIFAPILWGVTNNNFIYEFRDDSKTYNFTMNMDKMSLPASSDQMTLKIGSGNGTPAVNMSYPRDSSSNKVVMGKGNYMQVGLAAAVGADVRLSFEIQEASSSSAIGVMITVVIAMFYTL